MTWVGVLVPQEDLERVLRDLINSNRLKLLAGKYQRLGTA